MTASFDLVILIDCWESSPWADEQINNDPRAQEFYERIVKRLSNYNFKNVILASHDKWFTDNTAPATSKWLVDNIHSKDNGSDLKLRNCGDMIEAFREFPEALHSGLDYNNNPNTLRILICGQAFKVCTHYRPLGIMNWLQQEQNGVFTHADLLFTPDKPWITEQDFDDDHLVQWESVKEDSYTAGVIDANYSASANIMHAAELKDL